MTKTGEPLDTNAVKLMVRRLAKKSMVPGIHVHRLRHTFAINYLLNGGDICSLKEILGHKTPEMANRYLHFTKAQITTRHCEFSPMDHFMGNGKNLRKPKNW